MKNKAHIHNKATMNILQREPRSPHRKINVTSALSRVESELHRAEITAVVRYQTSKKESPPTIVIPVATTTKQLLSSHSSITATAVAAATPISKMKRSRHRWKITAQFHHAHSRSAPFPEPRNAFHTRQDAAPIGNTTLPRTDVFTSFIRPPHEKKTCAYTDNLSSTAPLTRQRATDHCPPRPIEVKVT